MSPKPPRLNLNAPPAASGRAIEVLDYHTAGEPFRIVISGYPELPGRNILERRRAALEQHDDLRKLLMWEPRGHADMYGGILVHQITPRHKWASSSCITRATPQCVGTAPLHSPPHLWSRERFLPRAPKRRLALTRRAV